MSDGNAIKTAELTVDIVSAYVSNNTLTPGELPALIQSVHAALSRLGMQPQSIANEALKPAVSPKRSVFDDHLICLEDGKKFKSLKRHLRSHYDMSPAQYREKWGLPADYPMVAPNYAKTRSNLAKKMGLGQARGRDST